MGGFEGLGQLFWKLRFSTVPDTKKLYSKKVLDNNKIFSGTLSENNSLLPGRVTENNSIQFIYQFNVKTKRREHTYYKSTDSLLIKDLSQNLMRVLKMLWSAEVRREIERGFEEKKK